MLNRNDLLSNYEFRDILTMIDSLSALNQNLKSVMKLDS